MRAGTLRHRVTLQRKGTTQDEFGAVVDTWTDVFTDWAAIQPLRGMERYTAKQTQASADVVVRMRYRAGVEPVNRIKFGARILDIESVISVDERKSALEIFCKEATVIALGAGIVLGLYGSGLYGSGIYGV